MKILVTLALAGGLILTLRLFRWFKEGIVHPDPWGAELDAEVRSETAVQLCHRCFTPQGTSEWFCGHCGTAVGPYNNWMPYLHIFSLGEVLRTGVNDQFRKSPLTFFGYIFASLAEYLFFAPLYWIFFWRNYKRRRNGADSVEISE